MIYILLPVHNRLEITRRFIDCLTAQTYTNYHLVLIDDGSIDGTAEMVKNRIKNLTVIKGYGDWWWAGSLQQGFLWIKRNVSDENGTVLIINDDVTYGSDYLEKGISELNKLKKTIIYSKAFILQNGSLYWSGIKIDWKRFIFHPNQEDEKVNCVSTRGIFLKVKDFMDIGGFHPRLLPQYASDYEFSYRAFKKGFTFKSYLDLRLVVDENTSGYRNFHKDMFVTLIKKYFSKKNPSNPLYSAVFVALACPWKYKFINFLKIFKVSISLCIKYFIYNYRKL